MHFKCFPFFPLPFILLWDSHLWFLFTRLSTPALLLLPHPSLLSTLRAKGHMLEQTFQSASETNIEWQYVFLWIQTSVHMAFIHAVRKARRHGCLSRHPRSFSMNKQFYRDSAVAECSLGNSFGQVDRKMIQKRATCWRANMFRDAQSLWKMGVCFIHVQWSRCQEPSPCFSLFC